MDGIHNREREKEGWMTMMTLTIRIKRWPKTSVQINIRLNFVCLLSCDNLHPALLFTYSYLLIYYVCKTYSITSIFRYNYQKYIVLFEQWLVPYWELCSIHIGISRYNLFIRTIDGWSWSGENLREALIVQLKQNLTRWIKTY